MKNSTFFSIFLILLISPFMSLWAQSLPENITISVPRGDDGGFVTMVLEKYSVRDPDFFKFYIDNQSYEVGENASAKAANPLNFDEVTINETDYPVRTYRGYVVEEPNSTVTASIWPGNTTMTAIVNEGIRYLWQVEDLPISLDLATGDGTVTVSESEAYDFARIKESDWTPTFGNAAPPAPVSGSGPIANGNSPHGWPMIPSAGFTKMQIAYDVQPEAVLGQSHRQVLAVIEYATNMLDLQFARDLGIQYRVTGVVRRMDTDALAGSGDSKKIWRDLGLMDNPGAVNVTANSIPAQHIVYNISGEGNPNAFQSNRPLNGSNFTEVRANDESNGGLLHEVSHTWGGAHFVYPRDVMSGGGSWFGPTTNQRHIYNKNRPSVSGGLPVATNAEYGFNVHPYSTPDLVKAAKGESTTIAVLKNDFDSNGDVIKISTFDATTPKGATVTMSAGNLIYTPAANFIGRDEFNYTITDGSLYNTTFVQVDVTNGGLEMHYDFEVAGNTIEDQSGANLDGNTVNFTPTLGTGLANTNAWVFLDLGGVNSSDAKHRAFINFGDVTDPLNGSQSISTWFKIDASVLAGLSTSRGCYIVSNSSTAIEKLISGYNIYIEKGSKKLVFEVAEQLTPTSTSANGNKQIITGNEVMADTWVHAVLIFDRDKDEMRAYMNGVQVGTTKALIPGGMIKGKPEGDRYTSGALGMVTYKPEMFPPFIGLMDEFRIYGRPITPSEINTLYIDPTGVIDVDHLTFTNIPADVDLGCGESTDPTNTGTALAYSPCYAAINITYADVTAANDNITRTWTVTDGCDAPLTHIQKINFVDVHAPQANESALADLNTSCIVPMITTPTATDACDGPITATTDTTFPITTQGTTVVTWTYKDALGNESTQTQNVIISATYATLPIHEDMESFTYTGTKSGCNPTVALGGGFTNLTGSEFTGDNTNWRVNSDKGISSSSGPLVDFTEGTDTGQYLYLRGSSGCGQRTGALITDCLDLTNLESPLLTFAYQAIKTNNDATPELHVDVLSDGVWTTDVLEVLGERGTRNGEVADWVVFKVSLDAFAEKIVNIRIWGVSSTNGVSCDLALDDIEIKAGTDCMGDNLDLSENHAAKRFYRASATLESNGQVNSAVQVEYIAGESITLKPGFTAMAGSDFVARIADCTTPAPFTENESATARKKNDHTFKLTFEEIAPKKLSLKAYPNPFRSEITIELELPSNENPQLGLYDMNGRMIEAIAVPSDAGGPIQINQNFGHLTAGIYYLKLQTATEIRTEKLILME